MGAAPVCLAFCEVGHLIVKLFCACIPPLSSAYFCRPSCLAKRPSWTSKATLSVQTSGPLPPCWQPSAGSNLQIAPCPISTLPVRTWQMCFRTHRHSRSWCRLWLHRALACGSNVSPPASVWRLDATCLLICRCVVPFSLLVSCVWVAGVLRCCPQHVGQCP